MVAESQIANIDVLSLSAQKDVADTVRSCYEASRAVYPRGSGKELDYGYAPTRPGLELDLTGLNRIVDYTPRDMTILVEAGARMADLAETLAAEGQHLPIDVPRPSEATIGGVVATNWNGPRRYGYGTIRDYVIGINAVDGRGVAFKGGGRVVKNVAGYDFCKLLTGSLGTLAVITQLAFKVKPRPECATAIVGECVDLSVAENVLTRLANLEAPPVAIDLLIGGAWEVAAGGSPAARPQPRDSTRSQIVVRVEGSETEVAWLAEQTQYQLWTGGATAVRRLSDTDADTLWSHQVEFSDRGPGVTEDSSALVMKIAVPPSVVVATIAELVAFDPDCTIQSHAGSGIIVARFAQFQPANLTRTIVGKLRPAAVQRGGSLVVLSSKLDGLTPHIVWGGRTDATILLESIKRKFDPRGILNPGRFVF